jgi:O-glycosyl hydrolase
MRLGITCLLASALLISGCGSSSTGTKTPPPVAPTVTSVAPLSAATGVAINAPTITATFSEAMNSSTLTASTFTLAAGSTPVSGTVSYSGSVATFTPSASLDYNTPYTATITTGAQSSAGTALAANYTWTFTTATAPVPPTVTAVTPASAATGVALDTTVTATFSQAMNSSTIIASTFTLAGPGGAAVSGTVSYAATGSVATFTPSANLAYSTQYTATITTGAQDSAGTALSANYTWSFTTAAAPVAPTVTAVTPANAATGVVISTPVTAAFSQPMSSSTITTATFTLTGPGGAAVDGTVAYTATGSVATFTPSASLAYSTQYTASITTGAQDSTGTALAANYTWSFTTAAAPVPPAVISVTPASAATAVPVSTTVTATFSQSLNPATVTSSTFTLTAAGGAAVTGTVTYAASTSIATFTPAASLAATTQYTATITTGVQNAAGTALAANYTWSFTTAAPNPNQATVNFTDTLQTIRGFGGSTAWQGQMTQAQANALYSPTTGLGLSILRMRIDPEGSASGGGVHGMPYETGEWDDEAANGKEAVIANPNAIVFASPWSPPAAWKLAGNSSFQDDGETWDQAFESTCSPSAHYCGGYLDPNHYADYANYLEDFVTFFNSQNTFNLYAISMQNEPEENVTYESCVWTPEEMDTWVADLTANGATNPLTTKLIMPESDVFNPIDAAKALNDPNAVGNIGIIGGHLYQFGEGVGNPSPYPDAASYGKEIWMTEHYQNSAGTVADALGIAEEVHNSIVNAQYNAYVWWGMLGASTSVGNGGLINTNTNTPTPTEFGYGIGQFAKFVQPGYTRVTETASTGESTSVLISAYTGMESTTQHYVIVAINLGTSSVSQSFTLQNGSVTSMTPYQTTAAAGLAAQPAVAVSGGQFTYTLPAQSVTTFVQ